MSFYCGLTSVLDIVERGGRISFKAHPTHAKAGKFEPEWRTASPIGDQHQRITAVQAYFARMLAPDKVSTRYTSREGQVQTSISRAASGDFGVFQREAVPSFPSVDARNALVDPLVARSRAAMAAQGKQPDWWPGVRDRGKQSRPGLETDLLGIDSAGRLLVIEVKPSDEIKGLAWAPGQVRLYSEVMAAWLENDEGAAALIDEMADQRARIGLPTASHRVSTTEQIRVVPVVAAGPSPLRPVGMDRLSEVHQALTSAPPLSELIDPAEVWQFDAAGTRVDVTVLPAAGV